MTSRALRRTLLHLALAAGSFAVTLLFMHLFPKRDLISRLSIGTAYPALFFLAVTLLLGPLRVLLGRSVPVSFDLRRDFGIWSAVSALIHTALGLNVHLRGRMWLYFVNESHRLRHDLFGFANYTGAVAAMVFALLLLLSNDISLRRLGANRWKSLQRWSYAAAALTGAHAVAYQQIEKRVPVFQWILYLALAFMLVVQVAATRMHLKRS